MTELSQPVVVEKSPRLVSLDALRGFDMLWIIGLDYIVPKVCGLLHFPQMAGPTRFLTEQFQHADWEGLHFEDCIFPLFVFIVGVSIVFALTKAISQRGRTSAILRIFSRTCLLYLLGLMVYRGFDQPIHSVRWLGVLQRIAICYGVTATLFCLLRPRYLAMITVGLIVGYWLLMAFVKVPGAGRGSYAEDRNLANYLDQQYLGGFKYHNMDYDPEGYLSTLPAIGTCLLGLFAGLLLKNEKPGPYGKVAVLILGGAALAALGYAWGFLHSPVQFPVIKKIWTSSFVLMTGGFSAMVLGLFYLVIDVWKLRFWTGPFVWVGCNAITMYMLMELGFVRKFAQLLVGGGSQSWPIFHPNQSLVTAVVALLLMLALARFFYRRGVFIRV